MENNAKNKVFFLLLSAFFVLFTCACKGTAVDKSRSINVCNWGECISNGTEGSLDVNKKFTQETGIKVNYSTFQSNEELFAKLSGGGSAYDVIIPSDYLISRLIQNDMLEKLNFANIPNISNINDRLKNPSYDPSNEYSVPYSWGLMGIFINKSMVDEPEDKITWDILWEEKYKGKILMFDNSRDAFAISLMKLGYGINSLDQNHWKEAASELIRQRPLVQAYVMDQIYDKMGNREAAIAPYYSGDAAVMVKNNKDIKFIIPKSGTNRFVDAMCIPKGSDHKEEAEKYINFMSRGDIAAANAMFTGYSTPNKAAYSLLPEDIKSDKIAYPDTHVIANSEVFISLPKNITKMIDDLWIQIKTGGENNPLTLVAIIVGFMLLYVAVAIVKRRSKSKI